MLEEQALQDTSDQLHLLGLRLEDIDSRMKRLDNEVSLICFVGKGRWQSLVKDYYQSYN